MSEKLRILVTGFGPFPGAPFNPTQPLVARLVRLRRPALRDVELSGHIFPVTYTAVDRELPDLLASEAAACAADVRPGFPYALCAGRDRARNAVTTLWPDADHARLRKGLDRRRRGRHDVRPSHRKTAARGQWHRRRRADLARCRQLSLQLSELARDRGDIGRRRPAPRRFRARAAAGARRRLAAQRGTRRVTLEELVDAGEAMLLEMVRLTRRGSAGRATPARDQG